MAPPEGDLQVRPTSDRAREALFSILQRWPRGPFLDLFSGTGAVALEAYSRGYGPVTAIERGEPGWSCLLQNIRGTEVKSLQGDALTVDIDAFAKLAVIFADPPYSQTVKAWEALGPRLQGCLDPDGILVWETGSNVDLPSLRGWRELEVRDYGRVRFHLFAQEE